MQYFSGAEEGPSSIYIAYTSLARKKEVYINTSPAPEMPEKPGRPEKYLSTPEESPSSIYIHFSGPAKYLYTSPGEAGEVFIYTLQDDCKTT